jgi:ATP-dependent DNA ligase
LVKGNPHEGGATGDYPESDYLVAMSSRTLPDTGPGLLSPAFRQPAPQPPSGPNWIHELKHDGFRLMARREGERVRLWTRRGNDWCDRYPRIVEAVSGLRCRSCLIDGE